MTGFGVFTKRALVKEEFIGEYVGEIISAEEAEKRLYISDTENEPRSYLYFFKHNKRRICVDASEYYSRIARYINDSKNANCFLKVIETYDGNPHLCVFTSKPVEKNMELRYDYKETGLKWRKNKKYKDPMHRDMCVSIDTKIDDDYRDVTDFQCVSREVCDILIIDAPNTVLPQSDEKTVIMGDVIPTKKLPQSDEKTVIMGDVIPTKKLLQSEEKTVIMGDVIPTKKLPQSDEKTVIMGDVIPTKKLLSDEKSVIMGDVIPPEKKSNFINMANEQIAELTKILTGDLMDIFEGKKQNHLHQLYYSTDTADTETLKSMAQYSLSIVNDDQTSSIYRILLNTITNKRRFHDYLSLVLLPNAVDMLNKMLNEEISDSEHEVDDGLLNPMPGSSSIKTSSPRRTCTMRLRERVAEQLSLNQVINRSLAEMELSAVDSGVQDTFSDDSLSSETTSSYGDDSDKSYSIELFDQSEDDLDLSAVIDRILCTEEADNKAEKLFEGETDKENKSDHCTMRKPIITSQEPENVTDNNSESDESLQTDEVEHKSQKNDRHIKHFCCYCSKLIQNQLPRHFKRHHKNEADVKAAMQLEPKNVQRRLIWKKLTRKGDHDHNILALQNNRNDLVVLRKVGDETKKDFVPCVHCNGFVLAKYLWVHEKKCFMKNEGNDAKHSLRSSRALLGVQIADGKYHDVHELIVSKMQQDELMLVIRNDSLLLLYGSVLLQKKEKERYHDIRYGLRLLARMLLRYREIISNGDARANDLVQPENYDYVLQAAKMITDYKGPRDIGSPNVFLHIGYRLKGLCLSARALSLKEGSMQIESLRRFLELYDCDWSTYANNARATSEVKKANVPEELPLEMDIKIFRQHCLAEIEKLCDKYDNGQFTVSDYKRLQKLCMARGLTFNARRGGELSKLKLSHWEGVEDRRWKRRTDLLQLDDPVERKLAERIELCYVEGKKKRKGKNALVPILFTTELVRGIRVIVENRAFASIKENNEFIFASGDTVLKGWDILQVITKEIDNLEKPELITPTRTRKYLSTVLQLLDMTDAELTWLTNHMGHTKNVHFSWYRKEDATIELTKVAKVLTAVDEGKSLKNKKIANVLDESTNNDDANNARIVDDGASVRADALDIPQVDEQLNIHPDNEFVEPVKKKAKRWTRWTSDETKDISKAFYEQFRTCTYPQQHHVLNAMEKFPLLKQRGERLVRDKVVNIIRKKKRDGM